MVKLNLQLPINTLSFGECGVNILYYLYQKGIDCNLFPIGGVDLQAYDKFPPEFIQYVNKSIVNALKSYKREYPTFKLWHIQSSEQSVGNNNSLFTFRELDQISEYETNILNNHQEVFVCCEHSKTVFEEFGVTSKVTYCPLGFDSLHFKSTNRQYFNDDRISFTINGKVEKRKQTVRAAKLWIKKFGNNPRYALNLAIQNPFFKPEEMNFCYHRIFDGQKPPFNVNVLGFMQTRSQLNELYNATDIVIDCSSYETWSLPSFTCVALGKHAVVHYAGGVKGWVNAENASLFYPSGKEIADDGKFFFKDKKDFSFGNWYIFPDEAYISALEDAVKRFEKNKVNEKGLELQKLFSWDRAGDIIFKNAI